MKKKITLEDILQDESAVQAILFKQGRLIHSIRTAAGVDEDCPTELLSDVIESIVHQNKKLKKQVKLLEKELRTATRKD